MRIVTAVGIVLIGAKAALAVDVEGVLPASLDQPRIYIAIARDANSPPLTAKADDGGLAGLLAGATGERQKPGEEARTFAVEAFLDTGASGIMLSKQTADGLGITGATAPSTHTPIKFYDVGIGGEEEFLVSVPYVVRTCEYGGNIDGEGIERYAPLANPQPIRLKVRASSSLIDELTGGMDIAGMPAMLGKVVVVDAKPLKEMDKLHTSLVAPGDRSIPTADSVVPLTYVDFSRFTREEPANAAPVSLAPNPMIGPNPFDTNDHTNPVTVTQGNKRVSMTLLLDSGATSSFISIAKARELGVDVDDDGVIRNIPANKQFSLPIGGIGGTKNVHGFYVDTMSLPVARGEPIRFVHAPVMVMDVTVTDPKTQQSYTLDGVLGMNYLVASASISMTNLMDGGIGDTHAGAFDSFTIDHVNHTLGLKLAH